MARQSRSTVWTQAACYQILNRGHAREPLFHAAYRLRFLGLLARSRDRFELRTAPRDRDMQGQRGRERFNG
jgi:hypothetical protein